MTTTYRNFGAVNPGRYTKFPRSDGLVGIGSSSIANTPQLSTGLVLDLDARFGVTLVGSDVSAWADSAGAANNFSEATNRPVYAAADANWGSRPSIAYVAANTDRLTSVDAASVWKFLHDGTGGTIAALVRSSTAANQRVANNTNAAAEIGFFLRYDGGGTGATVAIGNGTVFLTVTSPAGTAPLGQRVSLVATYSDAATPKLAFYVNGSLAGSDNSAFTPSASNSANALRLGLSPSGGAGMTGDIPVCHAWNRYFTASDALNYHAWAQAAWGL